MFFGNKEIVLGRWGYWGKPLEPETDFRSKFAGEALKKENTNMEEENTGGAGGAGAGGEGGAGAGEGAGAGGGAGGKGNEQFVPYARFEEVNTKYRDLEAKYGSMQGILDQMKGALSPEQKKGFKLDYSNPEKSMQEYFDKLVEDKIGGLQKSNTEKEQAASRSSAIKWFRDQEDFTPELEEKAARFITENKLQGLDPEAAIKLAHKFVTMGDGSGYTRSVKEGLRKPGTGGKGKEVDVKAELAALNPTDEKYEEKMKTIMGKIGG